MRLKFWKKKSTWCINLDPPKRRGPVTLGGPLLVPVIAAWLTFVLPNTVTWGTLMTISSIVSTFATSAAMMGLSYGVSALTAKTPNANSPVGNGHLQHLRKED